MELGYRDQSLSQPQNTERGLAGPSYEDLTKRNASIVDKPILGPVQKTSTTVSASETQRSNTFKPAFPSTTVLPSSPNGKPDLAFEENNLKLPNWKSDASTSKHLKKAQLMEAQLHRQPPTTAVLQPLHRYCLRDGLVKPYRAHHCRSCETVSWSRIKCVVFDLINLFEMQCVLKYDHHCPCKWSFQSWVSINFDLKCLQGLANV